MKILILGTSNSLLRDGWVSGLQLALPKSEIVNRSVGASAGVQFCGMADINFSDYTYVFFDSMPNDQEYYHSSEFRESSKTTQQALYEICATIAHQTNLIITAISKINYIDEHEYIYRQRETIARATGAQFLDFVEILKHLRSLLACDINLLYETPTHPSSFIMRLCGQFIGTALIKSSPHYFSRSSKGFSNNFSWQHLGEDALSSGAGETKTITNSLLSETFLVIRDEQQITLPTSDVCLGFYINFRGTNSYVNLHTDTEAFQLNLAAHIIENKILKIFIPSPKTTSIHKISLAKDKLALCATPVPHNRKAILAIDAPLLSIAKIIFWKYYPHQWENESLAYTHDYRWLTEQVKKEYSKKIIDSFGCATVHSRLTTHFGRIIMYDRVLNRCVQTQPSINRIYPNPLLPIQIEFLNQSQFKISVNVDGLILLISGFQDGLRVRSELIDKNLQNPLGDSFTLEETEQKKFSIKCGKFYLRAAMLVLHGGLTFDRLKADSHETFELNLFG